MNRLVIWGSGGHGRVIFDVAQAMNSFTSISFFDDQQGAADFSRFDCFIIAIGANDTRAEKFAAAVAAGLRPATCTHPSAIVSPLASIGEGTVIMPRAVIQTGAVVGIDCIINTGAIVEHDCRIGDHSHLSPGVCLSGAVTVGSFSHLGTGSVAIPGARVGNHAVVGAGGVVLGEVPDYATAVGVPVRIVKRGSA